MMEKILALLQTHPPGLWDVVYRTTIVYCFLLLGLRLLGKRELGQMNIYDLILVLVLANAVQNAMVGNNNSLAAGLLASATVLFWNRVFSLLIVRSSKLENLLVGSPTLLVNEGQFVEAHLRREGLTHEQVLTAIREHGFHSVKECKMAVLEVDGSISIIPINVPHHRTRRHVKAIKHE